MWDVPVHVIASRPQVLEMLLAHGFQSGLTPAGPAVARMHELLPVCLTRSANAATIDSPTTALIAPHQHSLASAVQEVASDLSP